MPDGNTFVHKNCIGHPFKQYLPQENRQVICSSCCDLEQVPARAAAGLPQVATQTCRSPAPDLLWTCSKPVPDLLHTCARPGADQQQTCPRSASDLLQVQKLLRYASGGRRPEAGLRQVWTRSGAGLEQVWARSGAGVGQVWWQLWPESGAGVISRLDQVWSRSGASLGQVCTRCGAGPGQVWDQSGAGLGAGLDQVSCRFGSGLDHVWVRSASTPIEHLRHIWYHTSAFSFPDRIHFKHLFLDFAKSTYPLRLQGWGEVWRAPPSPTAFGCEGESSARYLSPPAFGGGGGPARATRFRGRGEVAVRTTSLPRLREGGRWSARYLPPPLSEGQGGLVHTTSLFRFRGREEVGTALHAKHAFGVGIAAQACPISRNCTSAFLAAVPRRCMPAES